MADYIASSEIREFVCDYDHNVFNVEHLIKTYPIMYKTIRKARPNIPYIAISKPDFESDKSEVRSANKMRRNFIESFADEAKSNGDENIRFIYGETLFQKSMDLCVLLICAT